MELLSILIVENNLDDLLSLTAALNKLRAKNIELRLYTASNLQEAIQALNDGWYDIIITDLLLPDSRGIDAFLEIQKRAYAIPIILVGRETAEATVLEALKLGAQDYLPKLNLNAALLSRIIHHAIERHRLHESLKALSFTDELTGVYNRRGFLTLIEQQIALARRTQKGFYLFLIDFDYLKQINDTYGHLVGDNALIDLGKCLISTFRRHDIIGRIGGDEFAIVAINTSFEMGDLLQQQMIDKTLAYNLQSQQPYKLTFSMGRAYFDGLHDMSLQELLEQADLDLYRSKRLSHK
jgi:two-component system cell cycle response regulator